MPWLYREQPVRALLLANTQFRRSISSSDAALTRWLPVRQYVMGRLDQVCSAERVHNPSALNYAQLASEMEGERTNVFTESVKEVSKECVRGRSLRLKSTASSRLGYTTLDCGSRAMKVCQLRFAKRSEG